MKWVAVKDLHGKIRLNNNEFGITFVCSDVELTEHSYILVSDNEWVGYLDRRKNEIETVHEAVRDESVSR